MDPFKLAINMPGAISAGAYTAGVLDFLIEAIDEWKVEKEAGKTVPRHELSIEILTGASAGGMCAAIAAVQLKESFPHITSAAAPDAITGNRLYDSWVQKVKIERLLEAQDLKKNPLVSVLDCTVLDEIADSELTPPKSDADRRYISDTLTLILTLTNLRGIYYPLFADESRSAEEFASYFGDRIRFQYCSKASDLPDLGTLVEPLPADGAGSWSILKTAALATGAFPIALAPRVLTRRASMYQDESWSAAGSRTHIPPDFGGLVRPNETLDTLNVDGGVTDNDPFALAHDYLANVKPRVKDGRNPREADTADRAVLSIAPFPTIETFSDKFSGVTPIGAVVPRVLDALIAQSRFQGESLNLLMTPEGFSRFVIAPSDDQNPALPALESNSLGAFGGFFFKGYRDHDFFLGRRNCQRFLSASLVFRSDNPIIAAGLASFTKDQIAAMAVPPPIPRQTLPDGVVWIPLVPLCGSAKTEVPYPVPSVMPYSELQAVGNAAHTRLKACIDALIDQSNKGFKAWFFKIVASAALLCAGGNKITKGLATALGSAVGKPT